MWMRSAYWVGAPKPGQEQSFRDQIDKVLLPRMQVFPGVQRVAALWPARSEDSPPIIACQVLVHFESREAADRMLASDARKALRPKVLEAVGMFDGTISHIEFEVVEGSQACS